MPRQIKEKSKKDNKKHILFINKLKQLEKHQILRLIIFSVIIVFTLEMLSRRSVFQGLSFIMMNPLMYAFNVLIVLLTLSISMMFSRRNFMLIVIIGLWIGLGITNYVLLCYRATPLTAMDFYLLKSVSGILHYYIDTFKVIIISIIGVLLLISLFVLWRKVKKYKIQIRIPLLVIGITSVSMLLLSTVAFKVSALSDNFGNLPDAYSDYGFAYCFSNSVFDRGISEPENYTKEEVDAVLNKINNGKDEIITSDNATLPTINQVDTDSMIKSLGIQKTPGDVKPNIIMVQLESFFDVNNLLDYTFTDNPIPNFTKLKQDYSSGYLTVPVFGAGTVNTEFSVLSGMDIDFFGTGEFPYRTILQSTTSESMCYNLDELGYHSFAIHNNGATFYNRDKILPMLGFDNFDSVEYMNNIELNPTGWAKDHVLTNEIMTALNTDATQDFIYTITVQSHGKYQDVLTEDYNIKPLADPDKRTRLGIVTDTDTTDDSTVNIDTSENYMNQLEYYVNQLSATDQFVGDLIDQLTNCAEPTVVVLYGDHLPALSMDDEDLINGNRFQTEYVMWSNFPMEKVRKDLKAYQLSAYVMDRLGFDNGLLTKFHQRCLDDPNYLQNLQLLQYDMLYGDQFVYNGLNPYLEKPMKMGIYDVTISNVIESSDSIYIYGDNFTPQSRVYINDKEYDTTFVDKTTLRIPQEEITDMRVFVAQVTDNNKIITQSNEWVSTK